MLEKFRLFLMTKNGAKTLLAISLTIIFIAAMSVIYGALKFLIGF